MRKAAIVSAVRTPVGKLRGTLAPVPAQQLAALAIKEAVARSKVDPAEIDDVIIGNLFANDVANMGRMAATTAGLPIEVPGYTIDRQCSSSLNALINAAVLIESGHADVVVSGGVESDSRRPWVVMKPEGGYEPRFPKTYDLKFDLVPPELGDVPMIITAENLAKRYGISRQACDEFALASQQKGAAAWDAGKFNEQIVPVTVKQRKSETTLDRDETLRAETTLEGLAKLKPVSLEDGVVTAGNASPMCDGAGANVVMDLELAKARGLEVLATVKDFAVAGVDPNIMGIGPVHSTRKLLKRQGLRLDDIDLIEMNEAFAAQSLACIKELEMDTSKLNVNGGAIALGHPLAGTGAILTAKMVYEMKARSAHLGLITFCCGGGMGVSVLLERCP